jgi:hypothetical protein
MWGDMSHIGYAGYDEPDIGIECIGCDIDDAVGGGTGTIGNWNGKFGTAAAPADDDDDDVG